MARFDMTIKTTQSARETALRKSAHRAAERKALTRNFLIANARLEFSLTLSKQSLLKISNRKWIAICQPKSPPVSVSAD
jgi:hypothetical protein